MPSIHLADYVANFRGGETPVQNQFRLGCRKGDTGRFLASVSIFNQCKRVNAISIGLVDC
jgi:hypothetical protein